jgi:hypothetical protein
VVVVTRWRRPREESELPAERFFGALRTGLRYVRHTPQMASVLVRLGLFVGAGSALWALLPLVARQELGLGAAGYGGILGCFGLGAVTGAVTLARVRKRLSLDRIVGAATLLFAAAMAGLGTLRLLGPFLVAAFLSGAGWLYLLATYNTAAQTVLPGWVRARGMALYVLVFFGGTTVGSVVWGVVAEHAGVGPALVIAAAGVAVGLAARLRFRIRDTEGLDLSPTRHWPAPALSANVDPDEGPVLVSAEYSVDPEKREAFETAMADLRRRRRRSGAYYWELFVDSADPDRYIEIFMVDSWAEHLRQHERVTEMDRAAEARVHACLRGDGRPRVQHFLAARGWRSRLRAEPPVRAVRQENGGDADD